MKSTRAFMRRRYEPLVTSCTLTLQSPDSWLTQTWQDGAITPDRSLLPCCILPLVSATAKDGSWTHAERANALLADMQWTVGGKAIETVWTEGTDYDIIADGDTRGMLRVYRNLASGETATLAFTATIADTRTGENVTVMSDEKIMSVVDSAPDSYAVETALPLNLLYSPLDDQLLRYEYQSSHGLATTLTAATATDGEQYLRQAAITVRRGQDVLTTGYTLRLTRCAADGTQTILTAGEAELTAFTPASLTLDLRQVSNATSYLLEVLVDGATVCLKTICTVCRLHPAVSVTPVNEGDLYETTTQTWQQAIVKRRNVDVEAAENVVQLTLLADTINETAHWLGEGAHTIFSPATLSMGETADEQYIQTYYEYDYKDVYTEATDADGDVLTDGDGERLIFN